MSSGVMVADGVDGVRSEEADEDDDDAAEAAADSAAELLAVELACVEEDRLLLLVDGVSGVADAVGKAAPLLEGCIFLLL